MQETIQAASPGVRTPLGSLQRSLYTPTRWTGRFAIHRTPTLSTLGVRTPLGSLQRSLYTPTRWTGRFAIHRTPTLSTLGVRTPLGSLQRSLYIPTRCTLTLSILGLGYSSFTVSAFNLSSQNLHCL